MTLATNVAFAWHRRRSARRRVFYVVEQTRIVVKICFIQLVSIVDVSVNTSVPRQRPTIYLTATVLKKLGQFWASLWIRKVSQVWISVLLLAAKYTSDTTVRVARKRPHRISTLSRG